jgi:hypothetical protein
VLSHLLCAEPRKLLPSIKTGPLRPWLLLILHPVSQPWSCNFLLACWYTYWTISQIRRTFFGGDIPGSWLTLIPYYSKCCVRKSHLWQPGLLTSWELVVIITFWPQWRAFSSCWYCEFDSVCVEWFPGASKREHARTGRVSHWVSCNMTGSLNCYCCVTKASQLCMEFLSLPFISYRKCPLIF